MATRVQLPGGTVTFLLAESAPSAALPARAHDGASGFLLAGLVDEAIAEHNGVTSLRSGNDRVIGAFVRPSDALGAALCAQRAIAAQVNSAGVTPRIHLMLHASEMRTTNEREFFAEGVRRCSQLRPAARGARVVVSRAVHDLLVDLLPRGVAMADLGPQRVGDHSEQVFRLVSADMPVALAAHERVDGLPKNLPDQATSFVGRKHELAAVRALLRDRRLVTLTGAGGCGKTRLALQAAADVVDLFPHGLWFVELATLTDPQLVGSQIAETIGVRPVPGMTELQAICGHLSSRRALVMFDNCEHLLGACADAIAAIIQAAPNVTVLSTSRRLLGVREEVAWRVPSLSLADLHAADPMAALERSDAARLFVDRAATARPNFVLTPSNARSVAQICADLDGIPLAIELAAARIRMLAVEQIADGLSNHFRMLAGDAHAGLARHQTLRASVDWSWDLLTVEEQTLMRRLAIFTGTFSLDAVEEICSGGDVGRYAVLDLLGSVVDRSLVAIEDHGPAIRYRLLQTLRQYGLERLQRAGERTMLADRHRDAFLALAERAAPHLQSRRQQEWIKVLDAETANLAASVEWAIATQPHLALRFCGALFMWWRASRPYAEADLFFAGALSAVAGEAETVRASVLWCRGYIALGAGALEAARVHATDALALARQTGNDSAAARALCALGLSEAYTNPAAGRPGLARAVELARAAGDHWALIEAIQFRACSYLFQDDHARATAALDEAATLEAQVGDIGQFARRGLIAGSCALLDGRLSDARAIFDRAMPVDGVPPLWWTPDG